MIEYKYDGYYEKDLPYKMDLETLVSRSQEYGISEEDFVAYLRFREGKVNFIDKGLSEKSVEITLVLNSKNYPRYSYNPISDNDISFGGINHWYSPYKLVIAQVENPLIEKSFYVSDFVDLINRESIIILERE